MAIFDDTVIETGFALAAQTVEAFFDRGLTESASATASLAVVRIFGGLKQDFTPNAAKQSASIDFVASVTETLSASDAQYLNEIAVFQQESASASVIATASRGFHKSAIEYLHPKDLQDADVIAVNARTEVLSAIAAALGSVVPPASTLEHLSATDNSICQRVVAKSIFESLLANESSRQGRIDESMTEALTAECIQGAVLDKAVRQRVTTRQFIRSSRRRPTANQR